MEFGDTPAQAEFRSEVRDFISANCPADLRRVAMIDVGAQVHNEERQGHPVLEDAAHRLGCEVFLAGEPGIVPIAPAISNALFDLNGKRLRELPLQRGQPLGPFLHSVG